MIERPTDLQRRRAAGAVRIGTECTACGACLPTCPEKALSRGPRRPRVWLERCTGCWQCLEICPAGAIIETAR